MHIKQVTICGFRSYKDQVIVDPFSKEHNVVIGRNGTGKSNFFDSIRFVLLTTKFANLRQEERQALLHEGSGKHVMSAYVEIVFDNSDGRLPIDTEEVLLRRTIGVKKDEFFLNRKHITKGDVIHLLESAGFSRSNPYYIVQQGKVNALALMKDKDRLELLKEVAGTRVYEDRRVESLKIMHDTDSRREKIQEVIQYIEERLEELEEEKDELKEYQRVDKLKRALEYSMHEKELQSIRNELEQLERIRVDEATRSNELHNLALETQEKIRKKEIELQDKNEEIKQLIEEKSTVEEERSELIENRCKLELDVRELETEIASDVSKQDKLKKELSELKDHIRKVKEELSSSIIPNYQACENELAKINEDIATKERQTELLISKQSRKSQFKTQAERDRYLQGEIAQVNMLIQRKNTEVNELESSMHSIRRRIEQEKTDFNDHESEMADRRHALDDFTQKLTDLKEQRNKLSESRKEKWREESQLNKEIKHLTEELSRAEDTLHGTMAPDLRRGLHAINEMKDSGRFRGIYGPIIELVEPKDERFCSAIDEAAGNSLFHVVVDSDDTATTIMKELDRRNLGRVTFLPLNRLKVDKNDNYPSNDDVIPLINNLNFSREVEKAIKLAFGRKLLCRDLPTCIKYAETSNMDCLTLDGDMVQRKGALNGGYKDPKRSRSRAMMDVSINRNRLKNFHRDASSAKQAAEQADQKVSMILGEIQKLENEKRRIVDMHQQMHQDQSRLKQRIVTNEQSIDAKMSLLNALKKEVVDLQLRIQTFEYELGSVMQDALTAEEANSLQKFSKEIDILKRKQRDQRSILENIRVKRTALESRLSQNFSKRQDEIMAQLEEGGNFAFALVERKDSLLSKKVDLDQASKLVDQNTSFFQDIESRITVIQESLNSLNQDLESLKSKNVAQNDELQDEARKTEKILNKRSRLLQKREEAMRDIRELGTLPMDEVEKCKSASLKEVTKKLRKCNEKLTHFSHVNKKALDQYVSFSDQRSTLIDRKKELDEGYDSIKDLIEVLDKRKDEAILRTFKGVSHHFSEVFNELVPTGNGRMLIIRSDEHHGESEEKKDKAVDTFIGVQIKVNFRGEGDSYLMSQLSGGQKALVALAFIFAIQRCDPGPFYLFDEIDQALDSTHRAAVSALIHRQAHSTDNPAQFITSTFRPEMVNVADKFYGIGHQNKISNVHTMTKNESLEFIANIMQEEEEVGNGDSNARSASRMSTSSTSSSRRRKD